MKDYNAGDIVDLKFTSVSSGIPTALSGGVIDVFKDNSTTESTEGVTLTSTFAEVVGMNHVRVQTAADSTFYADGSKFQAMLSAGTVDSNSAVGYVVGEFSIRYGTVDDIADGTTMLSTDADDLIATSTAIIAESTATAAVVDGIAAGTTMLSTDLDDVIATSTAIYAESTATAVAVDAIAAGTTMLSTDLDDLIATSTAILAGTTELSTRLSLANINAEVDTALTDIGLEMLISSTYVSTDIADDSIIAKIVSSSTAADWDTYSSTEDSLQAISESGGGGPTAAAIADAVWEEDQADHTSSTSFGAMATEIAGIEAGTTMLSTDMDDLIATTTAIIAESTATAAVVDGIAAGTTTLSTDIDDLQTSTTALQAGVLVSSMSTGALADFFIDTGTNYAAASTGSVVKEIADNAGGSALTEAGIADAVWEENLSGHTTAGSAAKALADIETDVTGLVAGTTMLSTDMDDLIATSTAIAATSTAIAAGTTMLSTDLDDLIASTTALLAESTATAAAVDAIAAGTTMLSTDMDDLIATSTAIAATSTAILAESTATAAVVDGIAAGTTMLSTDADDIIATSTAIYDIVNNTGVAIGTSAIDAASLSTDAVDEIWTKTIAELSTAMNATPTVLDILAFQHMRTWNLHITTASSGYDQIYNDAGSQIFQAAITNPTTDSFQRAQFTT